MENINTKVLTALQSKSLDFDVVMREAYTLMNGVPTPNGKFNPVRVDADGKESLISGIGFSKDFTPVQNRDAFTVIGDLAELADIDLVNVGSWGNGAGVFAQINLGDMIVAGSDKVGKYLSIVNSHDGSRGFSALITPPTATSALTRLALPSTMPAVTGRSSACVTPPTLTLA